MLLQCPHCRKNLKFNEGQRQKIKAALAALKTGHLKLGCPFCKQSIQLRADGSVVNGHNISAPAAQSSTGRIKPPAYPDISWMAGEICDDKDVIEDIARALVLMPEGEGRETVGRVLSESGHQIVFPESAADAVEQMRFVNFAAVVFHTAEGDVAESNFHDYMSQMPMSRRRAIYYILIGSKLSTLYNLEALAYSANLVVNETELPYFDIIMKKGRRDYDELFGPYIAMLTG